jgi:predicted DNA-binding transcriptional regulator YafY
MLDLLTVSSEAETFTDKEWALRLGVSTRTIQRYISTLHKKRDIYIRTHRVQGGRGWIISRKISSKENS